MPVGKWLRAATRAAPPVLVLACAQQARPADVVIVVDDYRFELSGAPRSGTQRIVLSNASLQVHQVALGGSVPVSLPPGRDTTLEFTVPSESFDIVCSLHGITRTVRVR